jgi:hypothetical protein
MLLVVPGLFMIGMGVVSLIRPQFTIGLFVMTPERPAARAEVRAVYGGYGIAVGALLLVAPQLGVDVARGVAIEMAVSLGGMAVGRLVASLLERQPLYPTWVLTGVELGLAGLLSASLR